MACSSLNIGTISTESHLMGQVRQRPRSGNPPAVEPDSLTAFADQLEAAAADVDRLARWVAVTGDAADQVDLAAALARLEAITEQIQRRLAQP